MRQEVLCELLDGAAELDPVVDSVLLGSLTVSFLQHLQHVDQVTVLQNTKTTSVLGPVYPKRKRQHCDNSATMLAILFSLKTMEPLKNGVATHFQATPLFSMRTLLLEPLQSCHSVNTVTWCKRALTYFVHLRTRPLQSYRNKEVLFKKKSFGEG